MRRAPDDARGSDGARGGVDLIHASLSSAEKVDIARAPATRARSREPESCSALYFRPVCAPSSRRQNESNEVSEHATFYCCGKGSIELNNG